MKSKLKIRLTNHLDSIVKMFALDHYSMDTFWFGDAIKHWQDRKQKVCNGCLFFLNYYGDFIVAYLVFLHIVWNSNCSLYARNRQAMKVNFVLQLHIILITFFSSSFSNVFLVWFWMYTNSRKCYKCLVASYFVFFHMHIACSTLCFFHMLYGLFFEFFFHCFLELMWDCKECF
jgi:hypothetical protein